MTEAACYPWALATERWPDESLLEEQDRRKMRFMSPRALWANGPWDDEPDVVQWRHEPTGYALLMWRNHMGTWCGYVGLPEGHPLFGLHYDSADFLARLETHHGLTFSDTFVEAKESIDLSEELRKLWWLGFDCAHFGDVMPAMEAFTNAWRESSSNEIFRRLEALRKSTEEAFPEYVSRYRETYKTVEQVRLMVEDLAEQCAFVATVAKRAKGAIARLSGEDEARRTEGHDEERTNEKQ